MNIISTIFMILVATYLRVNDCPAPETPLNITQTTIDGITYSVATANEPGRFILAHYEDNRTKISSHFYSKGGVTLGHKEIFHEERIIYYMTVDLPQGTYTVINEGEELHSRPYEICAQNGQVSVFTYDDFFGPEYGSFIWSFRVEISNQGDIDGNGIINGADLTILLADWGTENNRSDINSDGIVDGEDLLIFLNNWS